MSSTDETAAQEGCGPEASREGRERPTTSLVKTILETKDGSKDEIAGEVGLNDEAESYRLRELLQQDGLSGVELEQASGDAQALAEKLRGEGKYELADEADGLSAKLMEVRSLWRMILTGNASQRTLCSAVRCTSLTACVAAVAAPSAKAASLCFLNPKTAS